MSNTPFQAACANHLLTPEEQNTIKEFSDLVEARMVAGAMKGYKDWQNPSNLTDQKLRILLVKALREADWGSVGAYAMMAQQRDLKVVNPESGMAALPRSVLVGEEFDRDFVNLWTRDSN